jgi:hypothetical protein
LLVNFRYTVIGVSRQSTGGSQRRKAAAARESATRHAGSADSPYRRQSPTANRQSPITHRQCKKKTAASSGRF